MPTILFEEQVEIPLGIHTLEQFRQWTRSDAFPERGRIDYIAGRIEVDMQAEAMFSHGGVKATIVRVLSNLIWDEDLGEIRFDNMRVASVPAGLSAEPDVLFLSNETFESGHVQLIPKANREDEYIEIVGGPDMVAEIVSDSSVVKDTQRLPLAYFEAGAREYWLVDARGDEVQFTIHRRGDAAFEPVEVDTQGFQTSEVFARWFQFVRERNPRGHWKYDLKTKP